LKSTEKILQRHGLLGPYHISEPVAGGSINQAFKFTSGDKSYFVKSNVRGKFPGLFQKEVHGLQMIERHQIMKTPGVIAVLEEEDQQVLVLEWIAEGVKDDQFWEGFGHQLAALHAVKGQAFGLEDDNYMGSVPQYNKLQINWIDFFREQRILVMARQCADQSLLDKKHVDDFEKICLRLDGIFNDISGPSLVHGDLWSGNFMCSPSGEPILIDPAVYYGIPAVDLGMTHLFGGFDKRFYEAYQNHTPFPGNYKEQWKVVNLYPQLIHLLLFGRSYLNGIEQTLNEFK
jgi:fructosamine-3-kinase